MAPSFIVSPFLNALRSARTSTLLLLDPFITVSGREYLMSEAKLMLHCGAREVTREQLELVPCPPAEGRWRPVAHATVLTYATQALADAGYEIEKLQLGLSRNDCRFFGTLTLKSSVACGVSLAVGLPSALDN